MKIQKVLPILAIAGLFMLQSCDEELFDVTESFTFEHEFAILTEGTSAQESDVINLKEKETLIEQYGSKIKKVEIESVKYWLKKHNGSENQTLELVSLRVADAYGNGTQSIISMNNVNLAQLMNNPTDLNANLMGLAVLGRLIESPPHTFTLYFDANINESPADFTVVFQFKAKMTANPLKKK